MTKLRLLLLVVVLTLLAVTAVACNSVDEMDLEDESQIGPMATADGGEMAMDEDATMGDMAMGDAPEGLDTSTEKMTESGLFHVAVHSNLEPLVLNEIHSWTVHVETADGQVVENAQLSVDGGMPEHNHGFPTAPEITEDLGGGDYLLEGVKFSMAGWWELKLNIDDGEQSDQVTFNLVVPDIALGG